MLGTTLGAVDRSNFGGEEVVGAVLSWGSFEGVRDGLEDSSKELEGLALEGLLGSEVIYNIGSLDDMFGGNEDFKFEGRSILESL